MGFISHAPDTNCTAVSGVTHGLGSGGLGSGSHTGTALRIQQVSVTATDPNEEALDSS